MTTLVIPRTLQIAIEGQCSGQPVVNVVHLRYPDGTFINVADTLTTIKTEWERAAGPLKLKTTAFTMVGYKLTDLSTTTGATGYLGSTTAGAVAAALSTMASCALVRLGGGTRDRSGTGRLYHGPLREAEINTDGRTLDAPSAAAITTAYNTFKTNLAAVNLEWVVASRQDSTATPITTLAVSSIVATQRRRLR